MSERIVSILIDSFGQISSPPLCRLQTYAFFVRLQDFMYGLSGEPRCLFNYISSFTDYRDWAF